MPLKPGQLLAHYRLVDKIGEGGMGVVWSAEDTKLSRHVAVIPARISPDGRKIAYSSGDRVWIRDLDQLAPREITAAAGGWPMDWSPDGEWLVLADTREVFKVHVDGGSRTVLAHPGWISAPVAGATWQTDGYVTFCTGSTGLLRVAASGGDIQTRLEPQEGEDFHTVNGLPGDRGVLYVIHREEGMDTLAIHSGGEERIVLRLSGKNLWNPVYSPTGHVFFSVGGLIGTELWAVPFSLDRLETTGDPCGGDGAGRPMAVDRHLGELVFGIRSG